MIDYYSLLGVPTTATGEEIKKAYRELVKKWHPDVCSRADAHERFIEITEAYEILVNPETRQKYDALRNGVRYATPSDASDFEKSRQAARKRAEEYINTSLEILLSTVLLLGGITLYAGKVALYGEEGLREQIRFVDKVVIGIKGIFLITMIILALTLVAAPVAVPVAFLTLKSLTYRGRFIGLSILVQSIFIVILLLIAIAYLFAARNAF